MSGFEINQVVVDTHHKGDTFHAAIPETVVGAEGSAKRNIIRKGRRKGGGKMGISIDDGSNYTEAGGAMDEHDPNFDSEVQPNPSTIQCQLSPMSNCLLCLCCDLGRERRRVHSCGLSGPQWLLDI